jgi:hypothetical protein
MGWSGLKQTSDYLGLQRGRAMRRQGEDWDLGSLKTEPGLHHGLQLKVGE